MCQPIEAVTEGAVRRLWLSDGWLLDRGFMSSLVVEGGPTTPGRHASALLTRTWIPIYP
jgi:hypothetical protein